MILHLVAQTDWDAKPSDQPYLPAAYAKDGFIHCTQGDALMLQVANRFYKDTAGEFLVLEIDESKVKAEIKWEAPSSPAAAPPAQIASTGDMPPEAQAEFGSTAAESPPQPQVVLFPHIYGPLNRDAIIAVRHLTRAADGTFTGYAPAAPQGMNLKKPSELANELVDVTGDFSDALARYKDRLEAHMDELDKNIKNKLG